jgi:hypothetical protein
MRVHSVKDAEEDAFTTGQCGEGAHGANAPAHFALPVGGYGVSVITEMELLAWPSLTSQEEKKVREFLEHVTVCELTHQCVFGPCSFEKQNT